MAYIEAYQATGKAFYAGVVDEIITYVLRDMTASEGGFLSAEDADSEGVEGKFYLWTVYEITEILGQKDAIALNDRMLLHFWDKQNGGLYMTADDSEKLLIRSKKIYDGAIPSGNSVATMNLLRLAGMTANKQYASSAESILTAHSTQVKQYPAGYTLLMSALEFALNPSYEVVIVGNRQKQDTRAMLSALREPFIPQKVVLFRTEDPTAAVDITDLAPFTRSMVTRNGLATAYVCQDFACRLPTTSVDQMLKSLRQDIGG